MSKKIDYAFKSKVLKSGLCEKVRQSSYKEFARVQLIENGIYKKVLDNKDVLPMEDLMLECWLNGEMAYFNESLKINNAFYHRTKRLKKRVAKMLKSGNCIFLTLTFSDSTLSTTSEKTRRDYVRKYLKQYDCMYIANVDYGNDHIYKDRHGNEREGTGREHYHALIQTDKVNYKDWQIHGFIDGEKVRLKNEEQDSCKLAKYISKLTNHAIKETTRRQAVIYSRNC